MEVGASPKGNSKEHLPREVQEAPDNHGPGWNLGHRVAVPYLPSARTDDEL